MKTPLEVHLRRVTGAEMKKIVIYLFAALLAMSAATPAFASHHRRHHRYHRGQPIVMVRF